MNNKKPWYTSKTYHGLIVILVGMIVGAFGGEVTPMLEVEIAEMVGGAFSIIGVLLAARGRNKAQSKITLKKEKSNA